VAVIYKRSWRGRESELSDMFLSQLQAFATLPDAQRVLAFLFLHAMLTYDSVFDQSSPF
jgi:hypothetical protein